MTVSSPRSCAAFCSAWPGRRRPSASRCSSRSTCRTAIIGASFIFPQLTTGPSSASFTPDGGALVYSMGGSLWRQAIGSDEAVELTHPRGRLRLSARRRARRPQRRVQPLRRQRDRAVAARSEERPRAGADVRTERSTSSRGCRPTASASPGCRPQGTGHFNLFIADIGPDGSAQCAPAARRAAKQDRALLLFGLRPCAEPVMVAGRQAHPLRHQHRGRVGHRRHLVGRGRQSRTTGARC